MTDELRRLRRRVAKQVDQRVTQRLLRGVPNTSRYRLRAWVTKAAEAGQTKEFRVLDAGAGQAPYRRLFDHVSYETADFGQVKRKAYGHIDHVCDLTDIPVPGESYDLVLCTQVLEHVPDPQAVLRELHRVLKPGGQAWVSAPFFYAEHEKPYDFHRFTQFAWRRMAESAGFEIEHIDWLEGYYGTLAYQAKMGAQALPKRWVVSRVGLAVLARRMAKAEMGKKLRVGMPKNYSVVMRRPDTPAAANP